MKVGDLVKVNKRCDAGGLWGRFGVVMGRERLHASTSVLVFMAGRRRIFNYSHLDVINESR